MTGGLTLHSPRPAGGLYGSNLTWGPCRDQIAWETAIWGRFRALQRRKGVGLAAGRSHRQIN